MNPNPKPSPLFGIPDLMSRAATSSEAQRGAPLQGVSGQFACGGFLMQYAGFGSPVSGLGEDFQVFGGA